MRPRWLLFLPPQRLGENLPPVSKLITVARSCALMPSRSADARIASARFGATSTMPNTVIAAAMIAALIAALVGVRHLMIAVVEAYGPPVAILVVAACLVAAHLIQRKRDATNAVDHSARE